MNQMAEMTDTSHQSDLLLALNDDLNTTIQSRSCARVKVLVTYWQDGDHPGYKTEGEEVGQLFQSLFHFDVETFPIPSSDSYVALLGAVTGGLAAKPSLFIVHYGGHGDKNDDHKNGEIRRSVWAAHASGGPTVEWSLIQDHIRAINSKTDILLLLDCCYAAQAARDRENKRGRLEIIAAAGMGVKTPGPGPRSFTTALIKQMEKAIEEKGSVVVQELHFRLCPPSVGLFATPVHIGFHGEHSIRLEPLAPQSDSTSDEDAKTFLQLLIKINEELSPGCMEKIGRWIGTSEVPRIVSGLKMTLARTERIHHAVQYFRGGQKRFAREINTVDKNEIVTAWETVRSLLQQYQTQYRPNKRQNTGRFLEELEADNNEVIALLQRHILAGTATEGNEALEEAINDENLTALGLNGPLQVFKIARDNIPMEEADGHWSESAIREKKFYGPYVDPKDLPVVGERIKVLAHILNAADCGGFHALKCTGWSHQPLEHCYTLDFELPQGVHEAQYVTLQDVIQKIKGHLRPSLDERMKIAFALAKAVENWHAVGWLHQGISSQNVIFFHKPGTARIDYTTPFLHGFDFARPGSDPSVGRAASSIEFNVYRHPDRQGTVQRGHLVKHDVYSLGVVLLEIGLWQSVLKIVPRSTSGEEIRSLLMEQCQGRLAHFVGKSYQGVVVCCLMSSYQAEFDDAKGSRSAKSFHDNVVVPLGRGIQLS
ncbi:hypothetical protein QBC40DRAFT_65783 [Triangularia verruculosa]|uniref:Protein kinase domain-containing protein n=1 Tax=Triangularia verruculosa TaxID=2587418 RepID=A0AAN6XQI5_9PEZI|nr:hypothetical protein QBC40DRAFT_65783 [Triangularia verruculosa]